MIMATLAPSRTEDPGRTAATSAPGRAAARTDVTFARVLRSEWIKLYSLRSSTVLLLSTVTAMVGIALLGAWGTVMAAEEGKPSPEAVIQTLPAAGLTFAQMVIGALAALLISSEYGTGMIRSTMIAVPRRTPAVAAKALLIAAVAYLVGTISASISYFLIQPVLAEKDFDFELSADVLGSVLRAGLYLSLVAVMGLGLAALLRHSAGSIVTLTALLLVLPTALSMIPGDFASDLAQYLPSNAGNQLTAIEIADGALTQLQGGLVMAAWALTPFIASLIVTKHRDV
jgi:ABC-2 type transport system permease protein